MDSSSQKQKAEDPSVEEKNNEEFVDEIEEILQEGFVSEKDARSVLINIHDASELISNENIIDWIRPNDAAIDIIGVVLNIQNPTQINKDGRILEVFNFDIQCGTNTLPIVVWDDDIKRIKPFVRLNHIIHLDSPFARPQNASKWTFNRDYILTCRSNTMINNLGKFVNDEEDADAIIDEFSDIETCVKLISSSEIKIALKVYLKIEFRKESERSTRKIGEVTDGKQKLTIYILDYESKNDLTKGDFIKIKGLLKDNAKGVYFEVVNDNDIEKLSDKGMSPKELSLVTKTTKRFSTNFEHTVENTTKKVKKSD